MKPIAEFVKTTAVGGLLVILPLYLSVLLLAKAFAGILAFLSPVTALLPTGYSHREAAALLIVIILCFLAGLVIRTGWGLRAKQAADRYLLDKIPGYTLLRGFTGRIVGQEKGKTFAVALAEIEEALVPAFVIEEHEDGRYTVLVPSVPTPMAGAVYILPRERVHLVDVPFPDALKVISRWGSGSRGLLKAMQKG